MAEPPRHKNGQSLQNLLIGYRHLRSRETKIRYWADRLVDAHSEAF